MKAAFIREVGIFRNSGFTDNIERFNSAKIVKGEILNSFIAKYFNVLH